MKRILGTFLALLSLAVFVSNEFIAEADSNDNKFVMAAAQTSMAEVMLGNLALQKAQTEATRSYGQMMVDDHTKANDELKTLAAAKNITLPTDVNSKQRAAMNKLSGLSGSAFDMAYMKQMVKDHQAAVKLFQKEADKGADADVKAFAARTLPTLQSHLEMARAMAGGGNMNMNSMNMNSNNRNMNSNNRNMNMNSNRNMNSNSNTDNRQR